MWRVCMCVVRVDVRVDVHVCAVLNNVQYDTCCTLCDVVLLFLAVLLSPPPLLTASDAVTSVQNLPAQTF